MCRPVSHLMKIVFKARHTHTLQHTGRLSVLRTASLLCPQLPGPVPSVLLHLALPPRPGDKAPHPFKPRRARQPLPRHHRHAATTEQTSACVAVTGENAWKMPPCPATLIRVCRAHPWSGPAAQMHWETKETDSRNQLRGRRFPFLDSCSITLRTCGSCRHRCSIL